MLGITYFNRGEDDINGQYVPKHPNWSLKNKENNIIPSNLDTINVYQLVGIYYKNKITENIKLKSVISYLCFYSNGRCLYIIIPDKKETPNYAIKEEDLNPNNKSNSKWYYYSSDGRKIQIEGFYFGTGDGIYLIFNYYLNEQGDTLTMIEGDSKKEFKKVIIPSNFKKYKVDW